MFRVLRFQLGQAWAWGAVAVLVYMGASIATFGEVLKGAAIPAVANSTSTHSVWQRVVVMGASASAGFMLSEPFGGTNTQTLRLERYLEAALRVPHEPITNFANTMFFMQPEAQGRMQVERALKSNPTLVVAPDFLFWFCYGSGPGDEERLQRFEFGLKLLEAIPCRIVTGDIPDCSAAANGLLAPEQIPSTNALRAANARLKEWAASHPQVSVAPISAFMRTALANQLLTIRDQTVPAGKSRSLLQSDRVHPTSVGAAVLALTLLDLAQPGAAGVPVDDIRGNYQDILRLVLNSGSAGLNDEKSAASTSSKSHSESTLPAKDNGSF